MLGMIMKGVENKPENLIMLCINPWCVYILNIEYNFGLKSQRIVERKEAAEKGNEDDQQPVSLPMKKLNRLGQKRNVGGGIGQ